MLKYRALSPFGACGESVVSRRKCVGTPSDGNATAAALHAQNRFSITRQLAYSIYEARRVLDLGLFINGLPIATFELKNSLTKQTVEDAVEQYRRDRDPREKLFKLGRCVVHLAVDDAEVRMCTELNGKASWGIAKLIDAETCEGSLEQITGIMLTGGRGSPVARSGMPLTEHVDNRLRYLGDRAPAILERGRRSLSNCLSDMRKSAAASARVSHGLSVTIVDGGIPHF